VAAGVALALGAASDQTGKAARRGVYPAQFPDSGNGRWIAERACLTCHAATLVTQQAKDSAAWEKSLAQMESWGVKLGRDERETLHHYLVTRFGPRSR
jgi:cytochrome c5